MIDNMRCSILLLISMCSLNVAAAQTLDEAPIVAVHLDHMKPADMSHFAQVRREWVQFLSGRTLSDPWGGTVLEIEGRGFYTLKPLAALSDLARPRPSQPSNADYIAAVKRYNQRSDAVLIYPHTNQVWVHETQLSYNPDRAQTLTKPCRGSFALDAVEPLQFERYTNAWIGIHEALRKAKYRAAHVMFSQRFGDGRMVSIWIHDDVSNAVAWDRALATAVGDNRASALQTELRASIAATSSFALQCRPELSN